jgi:hypothetical protein
MVIWYILPVLVCCTKKNLAALLRAVFFQREPGAKLLVYTTGARHLFFFIGHENPFEKLPSGGQRGELVLKS